MLNLNDEVAETLSITLTEADVAAMSDVLHSQAKEHLRAFVERIERLEEEKASLAVDIREVYAEAKGNGWDTKALRKIIQLRRLDEHERLEQEALVETYMQALDMQLKLL